MKYTLQNIFKEIILSLLFIMFFSSICYSEGDPLDMSGGDKSEEPTVITADTMELDMVKNLITLEGSVVVNYPESKIQADLIYVYLDKDKKDDKEKKESANTTVSDTAGGQKVDKIIAIGHVIIERVLPDVNGEPQPRQKAVGGHAVYDTNKGTIVLTKKPMLIYGDGSYVSGTRITLWKDSDRLKVEGNRSAGRLSRLVLTPQDQKQMGGEDEEDTANLEE
jgi:lipopolysaccharide export system protein LptA